MDSSTREASHAGSWYTNSKTKLDKQLNGWLDAAQTEISDIQTVKAVIGPHAGFDYSGPTAGWAYKYMKHAPKDPLRVFLLGPCHHIYLKGCGLSKLKSYETPIGDIELDSETIDILKQDGKWSFTDKRAEEDEHSLEMHLPYIRKAFEGRQIKLVPIMVGALDTALEKTYGQILAKYFDDDNTVFCVSSDFCHWGEDFDYTYYKKQDGKIYESIEKLDREGMKYIEEHNAQGFAEYLEKTNNTICGRHPIAVLLNTINHSKHAGKLKTKFVKYAQSSQVTRSDDSSVSYASSITYL